jgi:hypothetical protein
VTEIGLTTYSGQPSRKVRCLKGLLEAKQEIMEGNDFILEFLELVCEVGYGGEKLGCGALVGGRGRREDGVDNGDLMIYVIGCCWEGKVGKALRLQLSGVLKHSMAEVVNGRPVTVDPQFVTPISVQPRVQTRRRGATRFFRKISSFPIIEKLIHQTGSTTGLFGGHKVQFYSQRQMLFPGQGIADDTYPDRR